MQQKNSKDVPDEIKFYRKGGSEYIKSFCTVPRIEDKNTKNKPPAP